MASQRVTRSQARGITSKDATPLQQSATETPRKRGRPPKSQPPPAEPTDKPLNPVPSGDLSSADLPPKRSARPVKAKATKPTKAAPIASDSDSDSAPEEISKESGKQIALEKLNQE